MLSSDDVVLAIAHGWDGAVPGRTTLQKVAYFIARRTGADLGHTAHYFGPYSSNVAATTAERVAAGDLLEERKVAAERDAGPHDQRTYYTYRLTETGRSASDIHRSWDSDLFDRAIETTKEINRVLHEVHAGPMQLAFAAKVDYILSTRKGGGLVSYRDIRKAASELAWDLSHEDVGKGVDILVKLGLAVKGKAGSK
jgi:uncharacterized protein YwgA